MEASEEEEEGESDEEEADERTRPTARGRLAPHPFHPPQEPTRRQTSRAAAPTSYADWSTDDETRAARTARRSLTAAKSWKGPKKRGRAGGPSASGGSGGPPRARSPTTFPTCPSDPEVEELPIERERRERIARNLAMLAGLGVGRRRQEN